MNLLDRQDAFCQNLSTLLIYIHSLGYKCSLGDAYRTTEQATLNAKAGKGIVDSLHCKRLAIDINLFDIKGTYLTDKISYQASGIFWKGLHPDNRWGGDFKTLVDSNHFEMLEK